MAKSKLRILIENEKEIILNHSNYNSAIMIKKKYKLNNSIIEIRRVIYKICKVLSQPDINAYVNDNKHKSKQDLIYDLIEKYGFTYPSALLYIKKHIK